MFHVRSSFRFASVFYSICFLLAVAPSIHADTLYGAANTGPGPTGSTLFRIDEETGTATAIGAIGFDGVGGMDFQPVQRTLYAVGKRPADGTNVLITIDTTSGQGTEVAALTGVDTAGGGGLFDVSFRNSDRVLFLAALDDPDVSLFTVDLDTGVATLVGNTTYSSTGNGLGFSLSDALFLTSGPDLVSIDQGTGVGSQISTLSYAGFPVLNAPTLTAVDFRPANGEAYAALKDPPGGGGGGPTFLAILDTVNSVVRNQGPTVANLTALAWLPDLPRVPQGLLFGAARAGGPATASTLYEIDPGTGSTAVIGPMGFNGIGGMDFQPLTKRLYGVAKRVADGVDVLIEVNPATGVGSEIGPLVNVAPVAGGLDLSFRPDGVLFLSAILPGNNVGLYTVNLATGEATFVGDTLANGIGNGLGFSPANALYFGSGPNLYEVDDTNATTTSTTALGYVGFPTLANPRLNAIDFSAIYGVPFAVVDDGSNGSGPNYLAYYDRVTANVFNVGRSIDGLTALAWRPPRDPCVTLVFGVGRTGGGSSPSVFYEIDPATGIVSPVGPIGFDEVRGIAMQPGTQQLYGVGRRDTDDEPVLIRIDSDSGSGKEVGPLVNTGLTGDHFDLGFRRGDGTLFLLAEDDVSTRTLFTINLVTGEATVVGATTTSSAGNGLVFALDDTLFHADDAAGGTLRTVNAATGASDAGITLTYAGFPALSGPEPNALAVDHATGTTYVTVDDGTGAAGPNYLGTLDTATGIATHVGRSADGLDAIEVYAGCDDIEPCTDDSCETCDALLYGTSHQGGAFGPSALNLIDLTRGTTTPLGPVGFNDIGGMDFHPETGVLYAVGRRTTDGVSVLIAINPLSGTASEIGTLVNTSAGLVENHYDLAFRGPGNVLYLTALDTAGDLSLFTINLATGLATAVGTTGTTGSDQGLATSASDVLYQADGTSGGTLYTIDPGTGLATFASFLTFNGFPTLIGPDPNAIDFELCDPTTATISIDDGPSGFGPNYLAKLDVTTGDVDFIGTTINGLDSLAWRPVTGNRCARVELPDFDLDDLCDPIDNCPGVSNPAQEDFDADSLGDACDPDDDNDNVNDEPDSDPFDRFVCRDVDNDTCDDCFSGIDDVANDGPDNDGEGICDAGDPDDDNDAVIDGEDQQPFNNLACRDVDADTCDDCSSGTDNVADDGVDTDGEGICDAGDNCVNHPNPGQESQLFFPEQIIAVTQNVFSWTTSTDIVFVVGTFTNLSNYVPNNTDYRSARTSFAWGDPPSGGRFFLVRVDCPVGTWASGGANECPAAANCPNGGRDGNLP